MAGGGNGLYPDVGRLLQLSVVIDVYSRKVVDRAFGERMTSGMVIVAPTMGLMIRKLESVIHRSDQGSQYISIGFGSRCEETGVDLPWEPSVMPTTTPWQKESLPVWNAS